MTERFARIEGHTVVEIVETRDGWTIDQLYHPDFVATLQRSDNALIGWVVEGTTLTAPSEPDPVDPKPSPLSFLEFMGLFTDNEKLAIVGAAMTDVPTKLWYDQALGAQYIDLSDPRIAPGLQALVDAGLINAERRDLVLNGLPPE